MTTAERTRNTTVATSNIVRISATRYLVPSRSEVGKTYVVVVGPSRITCDCIRGEMLKSCWHVATVAKLENQRKADAQRATISDATRANLTSLITGGRR